MCLAKVYLKDKGEKELILESVAFVEIGEKQLQLSTIFGEQKEVQATIKEIDFQNASILLERTV
jgi:predicted RNA-binding protein